MMRLRRLSIRTALLGTIGLLNLLLAGIAASNAYQALHTMQRTEVYRETYFTINNLFTYAEDLSTERATAVAAIYADKANYAASVREAMQLGNAAASAFAEVIADVGGRADARDILVEHNEKLVQVNTLLRKLYAAKTPPRDARLADDLLAAFNALIDSTDRLNTKVGGVVLSENPSGARRVRFARAVWSISEYAGRQYALLGRLIAESKYPNGNQDRDLLIWQGKIEYAWELAYGFLDTNTWGDAQLPFLEEARTQFNITFEQAKGIFVPAGAVTPIYPLTSDMWLGIAAQTQDTLQKLTASAIGMNRVFIADLRAEAMRGLVLNVFLFLCVLGISLYSWYVVEWRVLSPVRLMIENMYRAARGDHYEIPSAAYARDEIGKLGDTLRIFRENAQHLQVERDRANSANIAKSEFLASMSHEIRTPLNVVLGITSILQMEKSATPQQKNLLEMQQRNGEMLLALLNDLLDVSKIETMSFELERIPFRLDEAVSDTVTQMSIKAREKGLKISADTDAICQAQYIGDPTRVRQILTNLCGNAIKFTTQGEVAITVRAVPGAVRGADDITIEVRDTGIGIPPEKIDKIFEKFTQADSSVSRRYGGSGLGLAISKAFVELMGGTIVVRSEEGKGSVFTVVLPLPRATGAPVFDAAPAADTRQTPVPRSSRRILLVEDYAPNALVAGAFLEQFGFEHEVAEDGPQAIDKVANGNFDVVLMDIQMPGMDGYQVTREIRRREKAAHSPRVRIIGLTAHATFADRDKCYEAGMDDFLTKPFTPKELQAKLKELVNEA